MSPFRRLHLDCVTTDSLPELDFASIEAACGLVFDHGQRQSIRRLAAQYLIDIKAYAKISSAEVKAKLRAVLKAIDTIEPVLRIGDAGLVDEKNSQPVHQAVWFETCLTEFGDTDCADFLLAWRERVEEALRKQGKAGRPQNEALRRILSAANAVYRGAGGKGPICYWDKVLCQYRGAFYGMTLTVLRQVDPGVCTSNLGAVLIGALGQEEFAEK